MPVYIHDYYGPGWHAKVVSTKSGQYQSAGRNEYKSDPPLTGDKSRVMEVHDAKFPQLLDQVDDLPPATIITHLARTAKGWHVRGVAEDNGAVEKVTVNSISARTTRDNLAEWEIVLAEIPSDRKVKAFATDAAKNVEKLQHVVSFAE